MSKALYAIETVKQTFVRTEFDGEGTEYVFEEPNLHYANIYDSGKEVLDTFLGIEEGNGSIQYKNYEGLLPLKIKSVQFVINDVDVNELIE
ncbi:hypothetical protein [Paenibacillus polymyxa]|uniref:Uncharacterized protein n=1 Tax=Paenibacillus polymyxa (strain SC2) TaxID=886882 RepID=E3ELD7_PAEPS|nr:hypothetical protein [Paenibacillus polymyxa]ADO59969.1 hypothetical protein PPSC2_28335 [Paenibacillus polymyxa SC2]WPQ59813.1 hypothetical protein SKN87_26350 [Paenibacillus polymyxa]